MAGVDHVDGILMAYMHRKAERPVNKPVVEAVEALTRDAQGPVAAAQVRLTAITAARDAFVREGVANPTELQVRARANWGAALAAEEQPFVLAEDTRGTAKAMHFLVSGAISTRVASWLWFLPRQTANRLGLVAADAIGVLKEVADRIKGTGFNRTDIQTDRAGARSAFF